MLVVGLPFSSSTRFLRAGEACRGDVAHAPGHEISRPARRPAGERGVDDVPIAGRSPTLPDPTLPTKALPSVEADADLGLGQRSAPISSARVTDHLLDKPSPRSCGR